MSDVEGRSKPIGGDLGSLAEYLGRKVRRMRSSANLTLEQVAARAQISVGALSQLERGMGNPSLQTLFRVADSLGSTPAQLLELEDRAPFLVRKEARRTLLTEGEQDDALFQLLTPVDAPFEVLWVETPPGHCTRSHPFVHSGQEMQLIISGTRDVHLGDDTYRLFPGDSITYISTMPHWYENIGPDPVVSVWAHIPTDVNGVSHRSWSHGGPR